MSIILILVGYWKLFVAALAALTALIFGWSFRSRGERIEEQKQAIKGLKAKEETAQKIQAIEAETNKKIEEVRDAKKESLVDRLNDVPR